MGRGKTWRINSFSPNSYLSLSLGGARGQCTDIVIAARNIEKTKKLLTSMLAEATGQPYEKIAADCERDHYLDASEALDYGIADVIMGKKSATV